METMQAPARQHKTNRSLLKYILLSIVTLGIYALVVNCSISSEINEAASRYDGKKTMHYALLIFVVAPITLGIGAIVWQHKISNRIGAELVRRNQNFDFSAKTYWLWGVLGALIFVGPFIYTHKYLKAMNLINADYNING
ncbi:MAG: DUF4234 domain-containing protein [Clostridia bacterium]|nr:DUF4234 domain-containing protein [Clostridia bacterium]